MREGRMHRHQLIFRVWLCVLGWLAIGTFSHAGTERRVVLLRPSAADEVTAMALTRIKGELIAAGFEVTMVPQREELPARHAVENAAPELKPLAVFAIFHDPAKIGTSSLAEIWVSDRIVDRTSVERMRLDSDEPERGATVLAVRAVELLKASLAEFWTTPQAAPTRAPLRPRAAPAESPAVARQPALNEGVAAQAAFGMLYSFGEIGPVWTPLLGVSYGTRSGIGARMTFGGLGSDAIVETAEGTARIDQQFGTLEAFVTSRWRGSVQAFASAGVGTYRVGARGTAVEPYRGKSGQAWSLLTGAGVGIAVEVYPQVALIIEGQGWWAWPPTTVRIFDTDVGRRHWPVLLARTGIGLAF
jgi:hypothetical protein